jgi:hypothetical protein
VLRLLVLMVGKHRENPSDRTLTRGVLMVTLWRQCMPHRDSDFVTAARTSIDARKRSFYARLVDRVELVGIDLFQKVGVLIPSHWPKPLGVSIFHTTLSVILLSPDHRSWLFPHPHAGLPAISELNACGFEGTNDFAHSIIPAAQSVVLRL